MKLVESYIDHYGHLQQLTTIFQANELNVVFGLNEAGKSTLFHFIETMLFGFSRKRLEVEQFSPAQTQQYGGYVIVQLPNQQYIKVSRYAKQNKGLPTVSKLVKEQNLFVMIGQQLLKQDEFEQLYLSGLSRTMFRDLCALTLDELQATSMKDDEQLNQHLYHATWESSKLIAQLEKKSEEAVTTRYRPKGTKLPINLVAAELKRVKEQLVTLENELELFEEAEKRLLTLQAQEQSLEVVLVEQEKQLSRLQKVEHDYPLYEQVKQLQFSLEQLQHERQENKQLLQDIELFLSDYTDKQASMTQLKAQLEGVKQELHQLEQTVDIGLVGEQQRLLEQYPAMESLAEDIEVRYEQAKRLKQFIVQKTFVAGEQLTLDQAVGRFMQGANSVAELNVLSQFEADYAHTIEQRHYMNKQCSDLKSKTHYAAEQVNWLEAKHKQLQAEIKEVQGFTFIPSSGDELIRSELSYSDAYQKQLPTLSNLSDIEDEDSIPARSTKATKQPALLSTIQLVGGILLALLAIVLVLTQFSLVNIVIGIVMLVLGGVLAIPSFRQSSVKSHNPSSGTQANHDEEKNRLWQTIKQLIVITSADQEWDAEMDYKLRQALQEYKEKQKELEKLKQSIAGAQQEQFDYAYQLQVVEQQLTALNSEQEALDERWCSYLTLHQLPVEATVDEVKRLVHDSETIVHNATSYEELSGKIARDEERLKHYFTALYAYTGEDYEQPTMPKEAVVKLLGQQHETLRQQVQLLNTKKQHNDQLKLQLSFIETPIMEQEQRIRTQYGQAENVLIALWQKWSATEKQCKDIEQMIYKLELERKQLMSAEDCRIITASYEQEGFFELVEEAKRLATELAHNKQRSTQFIEERGQLQERQSRLRKVGERQQLKLEQTQLEQQLADALRDYAKYALMHYVMGETRRQFESEHQPQLLQQASVYITALTDGKYMRLVLQAETKGFFLANAKQLVPIEHLSRGTAELVYFSLRLALLTTHQALKEAPLILDDPFVNFDLERQQRVIHFIEEQAKSRQIILLTCHEHIVAACRDQKVASFISL